MSLLNKDVVPKLLPCKQRRQVLKLWFLLAALSVIYIFISSLPTQASTTSNIYYVAPNGNDNNPGTINKPWRHINYATSNNIVKPGDTIYVRGGTYPEYIPQQISGTQGNYITYRNYPGETPIITDAGDGRSWRWQILDQSYVRIEGFTFSNYYGGAIQVRTVGKDITSIEIAGNIFKNQTPETGSSSKTIAATPSTSGRVLSQIVIHDNQFIDIDTHKAPVIQYSGEIIESKITDNVLAGSSNIGINISGRPSTGQPRNILVKGNEVFKHGLPGETAAGIYLDGAGSNIIVEENIVHDGLQGIKVDLEPEAASMVTERIIVRHNILYNNSQVNLKMGAGETCNQAGTLRNSVAIHNTIYSDINNIANAFFDCSSNIRWKNNIFVHKGPSGGFQYRLLEENLDISTWNVDNNLFLNQSGEGAHYKWMGRRYKTLSEFQNASDQDIHSLEGNPEFNDIAGFDFSIQGQSKARDAGGSLTTTISAGSGNIIPVAEVWFFSDGMDIQPGDMIRVGSELVQVLAVDHINHTLRVDRSISWSNQTPINYDYSGSAPDIGALEYTPTLILIAIPQDQALILQWHVNDSLAENTMWKLKYGISGQNYTEIEMNSNVRSYQLTSLINYKWYDITLSAMVDGEVLWEQTIQSMPTDKFIYMPIIQR